MDWVQCRMDWRQCNGLGTVQDGLETEMFYWSKP